MGKLDTANWYVTWCEPVVVALYHHDLPVIQASLTAAYSALESGGLSTDDATCLSVQLAYLDFQAQLVIKEDDWAVTRLPVLLARLAEPAGYGPAERLRCRLHLQMRINLDRLNLKELTPPEFDQLFAELPEPEHVTEVWLYISGWAFRHRQTRYLEKAYEFALLQAHGFEETWTWQRIHLMLKLVRGDATRNDFLWLIDQAEIPKHLNNIRNLLWPRADELGLIDKHVEMRFETRELELTRQAQDQITTHLQPHLLNRQQAV